MLMLFSTSSVHLGQRRLIPFRLFRPYQTHNTQTTMDHYFFSKPLLQMGLSNIVRVFDFPSLGKPTFLVTGLARIALGGVLLRLSPRMFPFPRFGYLGTRVMGILGYSILAASGSLMVFFFFLFFSISLLSSFASPLP